MKVFIEMINVFKDFLQGDNVILVLKLINFIVYEGEFIGIIGFFGFGKFIFLIIFGGL